MKKTNATRLLDQAKIDYQLIPYYYDPQNLDVSKIALENQLPLPHIYKTLVVQGDQTGIVIALVAGHQALSLKALAKATQNKKMNLLPIQDLQKQTGYVRGGCSPIGLKKNFPIWADTSLASLDTLYINAGTRGVLLQLRPQDLEKIVLLNYDSIGIEK